MSDYRRFEKTDWYAWAGCERFSNGTDPFIYIQELNDGAVELTAIVDRSISAVYLTGDPDNDSLEILAWIKERGELDSIRAEGEMRALIRELKKYTYAPDLAYELDHPSTEVFKGFEFI